MKKIIAFVLAFSPAFAFAQTQLNNINDVASKATQIGNLVIGLAISLAVLWIIISVVRYLIAGGEEDRAKGGWAIFYGVIGLAVILSIWGLVAILRSSFKTNDSLPETEIHRTTDLPTPRYVN
jgi:Na+/alanine symporter